MTNNSKTFSCAFATTFLLTHSAAYSHDVKVASNTFLLMDIHNLFFMGSAAPPGRVAASQGDYFRYKLFDKEFCAAL